MQEPINPRMRAGPTCDPSSPIRLSGGAARHLREAIEQMDLLLETRGIDEGLSYLVTMLTHLRAVRSNII